MVSAVMRMSSGAAISAAAKAFSREMYFTISAGERSSGNHSSHGALTTVWGRPIRSSSSRRRGDFEAKISFGMEKSPYTAPLGGGMVIRRSGRTGPG